MSDHFRILRITPQAGPALVEAAYLARVEELMARGMGPGGAQWQAVEEARDVLRDKGKREAYEEGLMSEILNSAEGPGATALSSAIQRVVRSAGPNEFRLETFDDGAFGGEPQNLGDVLVRTDAHIDGGRILAGLQTLVEGVLTFKDLEPEWVPRCLLKAGQLFLRELGNKPRAVHFFRRTIDIAPHTSEGLAAERELSKLGVAIPGERDVAEGRIVRDLGEQAVEIVCPACGHAFLSLGGEWSLCPQCGGKVGRPTERDKDPHDA